MKKLMVLVAALALVAGSAMTAAAADWNFYGHSRVSTFYEDKDQADTTSYDQHLQVNARIGANVKVSDELVGQFEYGASGGNANIRVLWGEWNFGAGALGIGQHYTPLNMFKSNQVYGDDNDMLAQGGVYGGRQSMIQLEFGPFQIAFTEVNEDLLGTDEWGEAEDDLGLGTEVDFPAIEVSYDMRMDAYELNLAAGYQSYELGGLDVDSWVVALGGSVFFGPAYVNGNVYIGENAGSLMSISVDGDNAWDDGYAKYDAENNKIEDNDNLGFLLSAGFTANDMLAFEIGYGWAETDVAGVEDEVATYYVQSTITLAPGVFITPEVGMIDGDESDDEETLYYGAKWQINF